MAELNLYVGEDQIIPTGSGVGFFGDGGFTSPVSIGSFNGRTFVTNLDGTEEGFEINNIKRVSSSGCVYGQDGNELNLLALPNTLATLNIRFEHSIDVQTQSAEFFVYDGTATSGVPNKDNDPSGLTAYCAEIRHTDEVQIANGLGDSTWQDIHGSTSLSMVSSPGTSGLRPLGAFTTDTRHDWYIAMSVTPTQFGDKQFGILFQLEFI